MSPVLVKRKISNQERTHNGAAIFVAFSYHHWNFLPSLPAGEAWLFLLTVFSAIIPAAITYSYDMPPTMLQGQGWVAPRTCIVAKYLPPLSGECAIFFFFSLWDLLPVYCHWKYFISFINCVIFCYFPLCAGIFTFNNVSFNNPSFPHSSLHPSNSVSNLCF